ncbi:MAG TPA: hypothetical protein DGB32_01930, partial [Dehalococcoidia bacterium]|nr:hypothetical protein [Dehalococcoidia bacterium]
EEHLKGSLEPGKLGDLALLGDDLRDVDPQNVRDVRVERTYVNGELVFQGR